MNLGGADSSSLAARSPQDRAFKYTAMSDDLPSLLYGSGTGWVQPEFARNDNWTSPLTRDLSFHNTEYAVEKLN